MIVDMRSSVAWSWIRHPSFFTTLVLLIDHHLCIKYIFLPRMYRLSLLHMCFLHHGKFRKIHALKFSQKDYYPYQTT